MAASISSISCVRMCLNSNILLVWEDGSGGNFDSSRKYSKKLFGPMFYSWCNCPLNM